MPSDLGTKFEGFPKDSLQCSRGEKVLSPTLQMPSTALPPCLWSCHSLCPSLCLSRMESNARFYDRQSCHLLLSEVPGHQAWFTKWLLHVKTKEQIQAECWILIKIILYNICINNFLCAKLIIFMEFIAWETCKEMSGKLPRIIKKANGRMRAQTQGGWSQGPWT